MKRYSMKIILSAAALILFDQVTKSWASTNLSSGSRSLMSDFFQFELSHNTGIAFGLPIPYTLLLIINFVLISFLIFFAKKDLQLKKTLAQAISALILAGATGNIIDRLTLGHVIDFIAIGPWPNFNLADAYIVIGVLPVPPTVRLPIDITIHDSLFVDKIPL